MLSMWVYFLPAHLPDGSWAEMRQELGERLIDQVSGYAPNFRDAIIDWTLLTPEDIEERIGMTDGNIRHVDMIPQQMLSRRPLPGWSDYRTPVEGLYLCGAGTHPGGEVNGAPGHNAAHVVGNWETWAAERISFAGLQRDYRVPIGVSGKKERQDLGSNDPPVLVECKSHRWPQAAMCRAPRSGTRRCISFTLQKDSANVRATGRRILRQKYGHLIPAS